MMNILNFYEAGRARSGTVVFPLINSAKFHLIMSTRHGNVVVDNGVDSEISVVTAKNTDYAFDNRYEPQYEKNYSPNFTGDVKVKIIQGLRDVYSLQLGYFGGYPVWNILDFETFIKQFPNLYSLNLWQLNNTANATPVIKGDLSKIPDSLQKFYIRQLVVVNSSTDVFLNISGFSVNSELKYLLQENGSIKVIGDLSKIPIQCTYFKINSVVNSSITYTVGKVWPSAFDTLRIPFPLTTFELDNLLIDMDNSITTKIGEGVIALGGWRSAASDASVASLQAKGFTVNVKVKSIVLDSSVLFRMDFQNNYNVYSNSLIDVTSGNGVGSEGNLPTFALSGRKAGEYCAVFNGSQSIKTTTNLPVNSDKVTIAFWMKSTQTTNGGVLEMSSDSYVNNAFKSTINEFASSKIAILDHNSGFNISNSATNINTNNWVHIVMTINRTLGVSQNKIFINGVESHSQDSRFTTDNNGSFVNNFFIIGQTAKNVGLNGSLIRLKIYNYPFTPSEVSNLYNSEL